MKNFILLSLIIFGCIVANAQSKVITEVFRRLPAKDIYGLTVATRDSMLEGKTYYPATNSSDRVQAYNFGISSQVDDYMFVSMFYETEQRDNSMIEIRSFKMNNGSDLIIVSKTTSESYVVEPKDYQSVFIFDKNKKLMLYGKKGLLPVDKNLFIKAGTPDSISRIILNKSKLSLELAHEKITISLISDYVANKKSLKNRLKGDRVYLDWIKNRFVISEMEFQYPD